MKKKLLSAIGGMLALLAAASSANADSNGAAMNSCKPHDWIRFGEAVETMDYATLAEMAREPELRACEFAETIEVLLCEIDPLACIEPAAPPPPPSTEPELPVLRITAPGAHIGVENDGGDHDGGQDSSSASDGDDGGGNGGDTTGRDPNDSLR